MTTQEAVNNNFQRAGYKITGPSVYDYLSDTQKEALNTTGTLLSAEDAEIAKIDAINDPFWNSLSSTQKKNFLKQYSTDNTGVFGQKTGTTYDTDTLISDLQELAKIGDFTSEVPIYSDYVDDSKTLYSDIDKVLNPIYENRYRELDEEAASHRQDYLNQLQRDEEYYDTLARGVLSNQYRANAQTYDALQSDMRKSRQNALEAGASAGMRIAGNVNSLLSAQNKQSQIAMDTSNNLAQMLLDQRRAADSIRSDYRNYMSGVNSQKFDYDTARRNERESMYNSKLASQQQDYDRAYNDYGTKESAWSDRFNRLSGNKMAGAYQNYYLSKQGE